MSFRLVSVYPSAKEINQRQRDLLPTNIVRGPYEDLNHYLSTHFSLLREDFLKPIREDLCAYLENPESKLTNIKIHEVHFIRKGVKKNDLCQSVEIRRGITHPSWQINQKRFMLGSLLIFSKDNFKTILCGRVADAKNVLYRKILVSFDLVSLSSNVSYQMIECNNFFEPYYQVLKVIQQLDSLNFPLVEHLIHAETTVGLPKYLKGFGVKVSDPQLNSSQLVALNAALSQRLVMIQGPPGTGKTFLGLKIAKQLLATSKQWWDGSPILVISFTNHALDQFLENLTKSTDHILRFGGQSKNPKMKNYTVAMCRRKFYDKKESERYRRQLMGRVLERLRPTEATINSVGNQMDNLASLRPTCIFYFSILSGGVPEISYWFKVNDDARILSWLLEEDGSIGQEPLILTGEEDRKNLVFLYDTYMKETKKASQYCMLSVSLMGKSLQSIYDKMVEVNKGIQALKDKNSLIKLSEKKHELKYLCKVYYYLLRKINYLKVCLKTPSREQLERDKLDRAHPFNMPVRVRWQLYRSWLIQYESHLKNKMEDLISRYQPLYKEFDEIQEDNNLALFKHQKIIGMTTTMAAKMHSLLKKIKCPIVIVEEAAEVLEAHIIPVLTEHCQHLILIGDHKQLKPTTADYEIETVHKLGVSMFERLINNNVQFYTLNVQHRMRPEISSLITPSIYPVLHNHESVTKYPKIVGMHKSMYFLSHCNPEEGAGDTSKRNFHEAEFLIRLAVYLVQNGYQSDDITILAAYLGQVGALAREQAKQTDDKVKKIKITSVDNFQGEESKIILLSLVRNNRPGNIGFLSIHNRVCVALSRAKEGMYVMGNMDMLIRKSQLWMQINKSLIEQNSVGSKLPLQCTKHGEVTMVETATDFVQIAPNGGCNKPCGDILTCGHKCKMTCHVNDHSTYKCEEFCTKSLCSYAKHKCPNLCYQPCGVCTHPLQVKLACGHRVRCFMEEQRDYRCLESVHVELSCGHKLKMSCNEVDSDFEEDANCSLCDSADGKLNNTSADSVRKDVDVLGARLEQFKFEDGDSESDVELPKKPEDLGIFVEKAPPEIRGVRPIFMSRQNV